MLALVLVSFLSINAQVKKSEVLVENIDSITRLGETRHFVAYCSSGRIPVVDVLYYQKVRGNERNFRVVSLVVNDTIQQRTLCLSERISKASMVVKGVTMTDNNTVAVTFTDGTVWETSDLNWQEALPGQKCHRTYVDGETYTFNRVISSGEVDQEVYYSLMASK